MVAWWSGVQKGRVRELRIGKGHEHAHPQPHRNTKRLTAYQQAGNTGSCRNWSFSKTLLSCRPHIHKMFLRVAKLGLCV